jgi:A/G-specific adenine glycosylase
MPADRPGDFVQAMMDVGATICRPKKPRCEDCPLAHCCAALATGSPERIPERRHRAGRPHRHGIAYWIEQAGAVWLVRRPSPGLLGGMPALPGGEWSELAPGGSGALATVRHVFTHFSLDLHVQPGFDPEGPGWWHPLGQLDDAGLPTLYLKAVKAVLGSDRRLAA